MSMATHEHESTTDAARRVIDASDYLTLATADGDGNFLGKSFGNGWPRAAERFEFVRQHLRADVAMRLATEGFEPTLPEAPT